MRLGKVGVFLLAMAIAAGASAQTKISGTTQCQKADPSHMIEVGDMPGHSLGVGKSMCTWTKPMEIEGLKAKDGYSVFTMHMSGDKSNSSGTHSDTMDNGDKIYVSFEGITTMKDGAMMADAGKWHYTGGTGKLKGIHGGGTYKGTANPDGSTTYEVEGTYSLGK